MMGAGTTRQMGLDQALSEARGLHSAGRLDEAAAIYRQILTQLTDQPAALYLLGVVALQRNDLPNAVKLIGRGGDLFARDHTRPDGCFACRMLPDRLHKELSDVGGQFRREAERRVLPGRD